MPSNDNKPIISGVFLLIAAVISGIFLILSSNIKQESSATATAIAQVTPPPASTNTPYPTYTPNPTYTPYPTREDQSIAATPVVIVVTTTPSPTEEPTSTPETTAPDSILEVGDTWKQGDRWLTLDDVTFYTPDLVILSLRFTNHTGNLIIVSYEPDNFSMTADSGQRFEVSRVGFPRQSWTIETNSSKEILYGGSEIRFTGNYLSSNVTELLLTVKDMGGISKATWRITVPH